MCLDMMNRLWGAGCAQEEASVTWGVLGSPAHGLGRKTEVSLSSSVPGAVSYILSTAEVDFPAVCKVCVDGGKLHSTSADFRCGLCRLS